MSELEPPASGAELEKRAPVPAPKPSSESVMNEDENGDVGIGAHISAKTLRMAKQSQAAHKYLYWAIGGDTLLNAAYTASIALTYPEFVLGNMSLLLGNAVMAGTVKFVDRRIVRAKATVAERLTYVPSRELIVEGIALPETLTTSHGTEVQTTEALTVLRDLQVAHLSSEAGSTHLTEHSGTLNPAMLIKGATANLDEEGKEMFLKSAFEHAVELSDLTKNLDRHAALTATERGRKSLRTKTTDLLAILSDFTEVFLERKCVEVAPRIRYLHDTADDAEIQEALAEALEIVESPHISLERYKLLMNNWSEAE